MTTETAPDPQIEAWSDRLEAELTEAGMEPTQARAYRRAFELGLARLISQVPTRHEFNAAVAELRQETKDASEGVKRELRFYMLINIAFFGSLAGLIASRL